MTEETKMNHFELMKLPWKIFLGYLSAIKKKYQTKKEVKYFKGSQKLADAWRENKEEWSRKEAS